MKYQALDALTSPEPTLRQILIAETANQIAEHNLIIWCDTSMANVKRVAMRVAATMLDDALDYLLELSDNGWARFAKAVADIVWDKCNA